GCSQYHLAVAGGCAAKNSAKTSCAPTRYREVVLTARLLTTIMLSTRFVALCDLAIGVRQMKISRAVSRLLMLVACIADTGQ
ncbi:MAG TPA: hypothetical protein VGP85_23625, partial [Pyrinomonadaceae bacterium]|nr:hypothetical protein [Pyrinomonadaceae bacterium]